MTAKMQAICDLVKESISAPFLEITTNDNLCSAVEIRGALQPKEQWLYGIFNNAPYFIIFIRPQDRYYSVGDEVHIEVVSKSSKLSKLRKYTGTPEKCIQKIKQWLDNNSPS